MWFSTAGPLVSIPMILASRISPILDIYCCFFSRLDLAVGRHHRRRTPRCPHGLQLSRVKVYAYSLRNPPQTLFPPALLLTQPGVPILPLSLSLYMFLARFQDLLRAHRCCLFQSLHGTGHQISWRRDFADAEV